MCAHLLWQWWISKLNWFLSAGQYFPLGQQMFRTSSSFLPSGISLSHISAGTGCPQTAGPPWLQATQSWVTEVAGAAPSRAPGRSPGPTAPAPYTEAAPFHMSVSKASLHRAGHKPFCIQPSVTDQHSLKSVVLAAHSEQHLTGYWLAVIHFIKSQEGLKLLAPY